MWPTARTCMKTAGLKMLSRGCGVVSVKRARNNGFMGHRWPRWPSVEECGRPEENHLIDSRRRKQNTQKVNSLMHFRTGQKHTVSARRSQHSENRTRVPLTLIALSCRDHHACKIMRRAVRSACVAKSEAIPRSKVTSLASCRMAVVNNQASVICL